MEIFGVEGAKYSKLRRGFCLGLANFGVTFFSIVIGRYIEKLTRSSFPKKGKNIIVKQLRGNDDSLICIST